MEDYTSGSILQLDGQIGPIHTVLFSPKARWLVAGGNDTKIQIFGMGPDGLVKQACTIANRNLTWQELHEYLEEYFTDVYKHKTCQDLPIHPSVAVNLRELGDQLANNKDTKGAIAKYMEARDIDPSINLATDALSSSVVGDPELRARTLATEALILDGDRLAEIGEVNGAIAKYRQAWRD